MKAGFPASRGIKTGWGRSCALVRLVLKLKRNAWVGPISKNPLFSQGSFGAHGRQDGDPRKLRAVLEIGRVSYAVGPGG